MKRPLQVSLVVSVEPGRNLLGNENLLTTDAFAWARFSSNIVALVMEAWGRERNRKCVWKRGWEQVREAGVPHHGKLFRHQKGPKFS